MRVICSNQFFSKYFLRKSKKDFNESADGAPVPAASISQHDQQEPASSACRAEKPFSGNLLGLKSTRKKIPMDTPVLSTGIEEPNFEPICFGTIICCDVSGAENLDSEQSPGQVDPLRLESPEGKRPGDSQIMPVSIGEPKNELCFALSSEINNPTAEGSFNHDPLAFISTSTSGTEDYGAEKYPEQLDPLAIEPDQSTQDPNVEPTNEPFSNVPTVVALQTEKFSGKRTKKRKKHTHPHRRTSSVKSPAMPDPKDEPSYTSKKRPREPEKIHETEACQTEKLQAIPSNTKSRITRKRKSMSGPLKIPDPIMEPKVEPPSVDNKRFKMPGSGPESPCMTDPIMVLKEDPHPVDNQQSNEPGERSETEACRTGKPKHIPRKKESRLSHSQRKKFSSESLRMPDPIVVLKDVKDDPHLVENEQSNEPGERSDTEACQTENPKHIPGKKESRLSHSQKKKSSSESLRMPDPIVVLKEDPHLVDNQQLNELGERSETEASQTGKPKHIPRKKDSRTTGIHKRKSRSVSLIIPDPITVPKDEPFFVDNYPSKGDRPERGASQTNKPKDDKRKKFMSTYTQRKKSRIDSVSTSGRTVVPSDVSVFIGGTRPVGPEERPDNKPELFQVVPILKISKHTLNLRRNSSRNILNMPNPIVALEEEPSSVDIELTEGGEKEKNKKSGSSLSQSRKSRHNIRRDSIVEADDNITSAASGSYVVQPEKSSVPSQSNHKTSGPTTIHRESLSGHYSGISDSMLESLDVKVPEDISATSKSPTKQSSGPSPSRNEVSTHSHRKTTEPIVGPVVVPISVDTLSFGEPQQIPSVATQGNPIFESVESECADIICYDVSETGSGKETFRNSDCSRNSDLKKKELASLDIVNCEESKNKPITFESQNDDKPATNASQHEIICIIDITSEEGQLLDDQRTDCMGPCNDGNQEEAVDESNYYSSIPSTSQSDVESATLASKIEIVEIMDSTSSEVEDDDRSVDSSGFSSTPKKNQSLWNCTKARAILSSIDPNNNSNAGSGQKNSLDHIPMPVISGDGTSDSEADGPSQVLAWVAAVTKEFTDTLATPNINGLEEMTSQYLEKISSCISKCYVPNRAAKMKRCISDFLVILNALYKGISKDKKTNSSYLDTMSELMAYYIDMEIQASSRAKENPQVIASKLSTTLFIFLENSHDHILDSMLKANNINKNFWELCSLIFCSVLKGYPKKIMSEFTYVRYILAYKMWKRVVPGPDERKEVVSLACHRLRTPPLFVEKIRSGLLNGIIPKVPRKRCDVTTFLIQAKFDVREKAKAFLKYILESKTNVTFIPAVPSIKTDIPFLVGHPPDFGPSLDMVIQEPPNFEEECRREQATLDMRILDDLWKSVNHRLSFRELLRMQYVTTFNKVETRAAEKKKFHSVLKNKKVVRVLPADNNVRGSIKSVEKPQTDSPDVTIVLSDDSDKCNVGTVEVARKSKLSRLSRSPALGQSVPVVRLKQERVSPTRAVPITEVPPPPKEVVFPTEVTIPQTVLKRPMMTPIQIKREVIDNDDCIIMESPEPPVVTVPEPVTENTEVLGIDHSGSVELEDSVPLKKADVCQQNSPYMVPISEKITNDATKTDELDGFKEEKVLDPPANEKEINIRKDLFDTVQYPDECRKELTTDVPPQSLESLPKTDKVSISVDNGKDASMDDSSGAKSDIALFDDEESSWSPSGGSQELIRNVVDSFIQHLTPPDDVEGRLNSANVNIDFSLEATTDENNMQSCEMYSEDGSPHAKRRRISDDLPSNPEGQVEEIDIGHKSTGDNMSTEKLEDQPSKPSEDEEFPDPVLRALHNNTCRWDHVVFMLQTKLRELLPTNITTVIPSPVEMDGDTGQPVERCSCSQCIGNFKALMFNHKALVGFQNDVLKASRESEGEEGATNSAVASTSDHMEPKQEDENMELDDDGSGAAESGPQLPFKKRKALVCSDGTSKDDGASPQYSDSSKDGIPVDYPSTPMLSIALLASSPNSYASPPLPDSSTYSSQPPLVTGSGTSCTSTVSGATSFPSTEISSGYCSSGRSSQLGFSSAQPEAGFPYIASTVTLNPTSLSDGSSYNTAPSDMEHSMLSTGFKANYTSAFPSGGFPANPSDVLRSEYGSFTSKPPGGGFPPFSAVVHPLTNFPGNAVRREPHTVDTHYQVSEKSTRRVATTRRFVTPAQLKQAFIAKDTSSCSEPSSYSEPASHSRKHTSSTPEPRSSRAKKEPSTSSRKSARNSKKKK